MGYYSDVRGAYVFSSKEKRDSFYEAAKKEVRSDFESSDLEALDSLIKFTSVEFFGFRYGYDYVKWYNGWMLFPLRLQELAIEHGGAYSFVRVGEEIGDAEYECDVHEDFLDCDIWSIYRPQIYIENDWYIEDEE
jgi:hypothetical protein